MNRPTRKITQGGCFCGAVNLRFEGGISRVVNCHCGQCRRLSGAAFTTWVSVDRKALTVLGEDMLSRFAATANVTRHFCKNCGAHVFTAGIRYPDIVGIPAGIIMEGGFLEPSAHYFVSDKIAWFDIADDKPQFGGESGFEPMQG